MEFAWILDILSLEKNTNSRLGFLEKKDGVCTNSRLKFTDIKHGVCMNRSLAFSGEKKLLLNE